MRQTETWLMAGAFCASIFLSTASADVIQSAPDGFQLKLERTSTLSPDDLFSKIGNLSAWWASDHTYSGDAGNLRLTGMKPGQLWLESWEHGQVQHGRVIAMTDSDQEKMIRFEAALGPLQGIGVNAILTIKVTPESDPETPDLSTVRFDYHVTGASFQKLDQWAAGVDGVLSQQIKTLAVEQS